MGTHIACWWDCTMMQPLQKALCGFLKRLKFPYNSVLVDLAPREKYKEMWGLISGSGRSFAEGNSNPLQYSGLENPMDRGDWWAI